MATDGNGDVIVRTYQDRYAPTGEGTIHVTANGDRWREVPRVLHLNTNATGARHGVIRDGRIFPRFE